MKTTRFETFLIVVGIALLYCAVCFGGPSDKLWKAVCMKESTNRPWVYGDNGKAGGIAQIHRGVVVDCNKFQHKKKFTMKDRFNVAKSHEMFVIYLTNVVGKYASDEEYARTWNQGYKNRWNKKASSYWAAIQRIERSGKE